MKYFENSEFNPNIIADNFTKFLVKFHIDDDNNYYHLQVMTEIFSVVFSNYEDERLDYALESKDEELFVELMENSEWGDTIHGRNSGKYFSNRDTAIQMLSQNFEEAFKIIDENFGIEVNARIPQMIKDNPQGVDVLVRWAITAELSRTFFWWWKYNVIEVYDAYEEMDYIE